MNSRIWQFGPRNGANRVTWLVWVCTGLDVGSCALGSDSGCHSAAGRITGPQNHLGWKRPLGSPSPTVSLTCRVPSLNHAP